MAELIEQAQAIYELDLKPEMEEKLADDIKKLWNQGLTQAKIAVKLGVTRAKARNYL